MATDRLINETQGSQLISGLTAIASEIASINTNAVRPNSNTATENDIMVYGSNAYTAKDSGVSIETAQITGSADTKLPTSKNIKTNVAGTAVLTNYPSTTPTSIQSVEATDTITQAIKKVEDNTRINNTNILSIYDTGYAQKNLFNPTISTGSTSGFNFVNDNGVISVTSGSNVNSQNITLGSITLTAGNYYFSGCADGGSNSSYRLDLRVGATVSSILYDSTTIEGFTVTETTTYIVNMRIQGGYSFSSTTVFKPMISKIGNLPFQPYAMSNMELTEKLVPSAYTAPTPDTDVTIASGGYCKVGNLCIVCIRCTVASAFSQNARLFSQLPQPVADSSLATSAVIPVANNLKLNLMIAGTGELKNYDSTAISANDTVILSAVYLAK